MQSISVVICTHNPREDFLRRVLQALRKQILPQDLWELLLIDNASREPLARKWDLSWHKSSRVIREDELGLTAARLRGIREASAELLVFVDDDNELEANYLAECLTISEKYPFLGAWGGQVIPEYETPPNNEIRPFLSYLLIREFEEIKWSNTLNFHETSPCGAGMAIRRTVVNNYLQLVSTDQRRKELGRKGEAVFAGEDSDMAMCSRRIGLGTGIFPNLRLTHLMPNSRLTQSFILKAAFGGAYSFTLLEYLHGLRKQPTSERLLRRALMLFRQLRLSHFEKQLAAEQRKGESQAWLMIRRWQEQTLGK